VTPFAPATLLQGVFPPGMPGIPPQAVEIAQSFFTMVAVIALGIPIVRAVTRRWLDRAPTSIVQIPSDVTARLERIEQAVEAVAIEVERIAEAQRFSAKLMADHRALPRGEPAVDNRAAGDQVARPDQSR